MDFAVPKSVARMRMDAPETPLEASSVASPAAGYSSRLQCGSGAGSANRPSDSRMRGAFDARDRWELSEVEVLMRLPAGPSR